MATLDSLKRALRDKAPTTSSPRQPLTDEQHSAAFDSLLRGSAWVKYQDFIIPRLTEVLGPIFESRNQVAVLEIGPGPESVLGHLPLPMRRKINKYVAFEPNNLFSTGLEKWLSSTSKEESPFPCLESPPDIRRTPFGLDTEPNMGTNTIGGREKYDVVLFCHSMYGMSPKRRVIEKALAFLVMRPEKGIVVVFHRDGALDLDGLVCHRTASFPAGVVRVEDEDEVLDCFAPFIAGFTMRCGDEATRAEWRKVCRALSRREETHPSQLSFSAPEIMVAFTINATTLWKLKALVPLVEGDRPIKNREARLHRPAAIVKPRNVQDVQKCVKWALEHETGLTVLGGGHGGQCLWPNVVAVDMSAFTILQILEEGAYGRRNVSESGPLVVVEAGCKTGSIVAKTMAAGLTVPLGSRPSVGAGLWLQGGIGHLARRHGLSCDSIVGAVLVCVKSGRVLYVGQVPDHFTPSGAVRAEDDAELLWGIRGAGTNFGIVTSVTFKAYPAPKYGIRDRVISPKTDLYARLQLGAFDEFVAGTLGRDSSADAYLYCDGDELRLGVTQFDSTGTVPPATAGTIGSLNRVTEGKVAITDAVGSFDAEMYMATMHGGHGGGVTSAFKRCLFLKRIGAADVADRLVAAVRSRPSPFCYLHLLHGGGAVNEVASDATAFGCRDWDFACVITGIWPRDQDGTGVARATVKWVYDVAADLLPISTGAYGADLGPDPRDAELASRAFGRNLPRLARLKRKWDPHNILAYSCPLPKAPMEPKLILLVTGDHGAGKDYSAELWVSVFATTYTKDNKSITARTVSISEATKREYAAATGADIGRLLQDRAYKEEHRAALTQFYQCQLEARPQLAEEHFLSVVYGAADVDVLLITGMRDEAPVATLGHLVPDSRLLEVCVEAPTEARLDRRGGSGGNGDVEMEVGNMDGEADESKSKALDHRPCLTFNNDTPGNEAAKAFAEERLLPFVHEDLHRLENMARPALDFPRRGIDFRHVLNITQQPGGLALCTSLLRARLGDWSKIGAIACCEAGGFVFASALALRVNIPLALIRGAGKLPPPVLSADKQASHISSSTPHGRGETRIEMERGVIPRGASVVVVDDVLATGETLCAVLHLLMKASVDVEDITVMVVAEFPAHRGRELLRRCGFGRVGIQSLLAFGGL